MERIDHIHVLEVQRGGLVGYVDGMVQRDVPYRERLELGVSRGDSSPVLIVQLGEAYRHLPAAGTGSGHHDERARRLDELVASVSVIGRYEVHVGRIARYRIVAVHLEAQGLGLPLELVGGSLPVVAGDDYPAHRDPPVVEGVHQPEGLHVVSDAEVLADLVVDYVLGADRYYRLGLVPELHEHPDLAVRHESRKHPGRMVVVEELPSEFQIQLAAGAAYAVADVLGLHAEIEVVVETRHGPRLCGGCL